jgi:acyl-CoA synthetase (NDP forming)
LDRIFYPDSGVVIGVSEHPENLAANIVRNLLALGYGGDIYVNPLLVFEHSVAAVDARVVLKGRKT